MKYSKYFGAKRRGFIKSESNLAPRGVSHFKSENIRCDINSTQKLDYWDKLTKKKKQVDLKLILSSILNGVAFLRFLCY